MWISSAIDLIDLESMEILIENNTNEKTLIKCWCDIEISIVSD